MRERGLSSWEMSLGSEPELSLAAVVLPRSSRLAAEDTDTWLEPSWVLSRRSAVLAALQGVKDGTEWDKWRKILRFFLKGDGCALRAVRGF